MRSSLVQTVLQALVLLNSSSLWITKGSPLLDERGLHVVLGLLTEATAPGTVEPEEIAIGTVAQSSLGQVMARVQFISADRNGVGQGWRKGTQLAGSWTVFRGRCQTASSRVANSIAVHFDRVEALET